MNSNAIITRSGFAEEALSFSENATILHLKFRKGPANNPESCLRFLKNILFLSDSFKNESRDRKTVSKKVSRTRNVREGIRKMINRENVRSETVDKLIYFVRSGKIRAIKAILAGEEITVTSDSDFTQLLIYFLQKN